MMMMMTDDDVTSQGAWTRDQGVKWPP